MPEIDLERLSPELRAALERELTPKPERRESVAVNFVYDPDDEASVTKGYERGHLTDDDLKSFGFADLLAKLKKKLGADDDGGASGGEGDDGREREPNRRGYFAKRGGDDE